MVLRWHNCLNAGRFEDLSLHTEIVHVVIPSLKAAAARVWVQTVACQLGQPGTPQDLAVCSAVLYCSSVTDRFAQFSLFTINYVSLARISSYSKPPEAPVSVLIHRSVLTCTLSCLRVLKVQLISCVIIEALQLP
jgi:hypothetical protein